MIEHVDLADPEFEPTEEQLQGLAARAFAGVRAAHEQGLQRIRSEIARLRETVLASLGDTAPATGEHES